nr:uncharacterized protein LOC124806267 [Hydra vulgaris]
MVYMKRICGESVDNDSVLLTKHITRIEFCFFIRIDKDHSNIHPQKTCYRCFSILRNIEKGSNTELKIRSWPENCNLTECVCFKSNKGRKKNKKISGRPSSISYKENIWTRHKINNIQSKLSPQTKLNLKLQDINCTLNPHVHLCVCTICNDIMHKPIIIKNCLHSFCASCLLPLIIGKQIAKTKCPKCSLSIPSDGLISSTNVIEMIENLQEVCKQGCGRLFKITQLSERKKHQKTCQKTQISSSTTLSLPTSSTSQINLSDIFALDSTSIIPRNIEDAALHVIKQKMSQTTSNVIEFPTGGPRPLCFTLTPRAYKESSDVCLRTIRRRQLQLKHNMSKTCGESISSTIKQTATLLKSFNENEKEHILSKSNISKAKISAEEMISLKANMSSTYVNMKILSRWLKNKNVICASNAKQRNVAKNWSCDALIVKNAPFMVEKKDSKGSYEIKELPCAYIENLQGHITNVLDRLDSNNLLLYNKIKDNKIHIKIGGDYGGDSFKMFYQVANVEKPNAKTNTTIFNIFEAKDYTTNLKISLARFTSDIDLLQKMIWK